MDTNKEYLVKKFNNECLGDGRTYWEEEDICEEMDKDNYSCGSDGILCKNCAKNINLYNLGIAALKEKVDDMEKFLGIAALKERVSDMENFLRNKFPDELNY